VERRKMTAIPATYLKISETKSMEMIIQGKNWQ
jgi:hypothetical protein